ncbi:hypothetical protein WDW86_04810, partial [Bdellovibrionota bacterium FG-2]
MAQPFRVQVVYRNYIPLNSPYSSFWNNPPEGVEFLIPKAKPYLQKFFWIYRSFGKLPGVRWAVKKANQIFFETPGGGGAAAKFDCLF